MSVSSSAKPFMLFKALGLLLLQLAVSTAQQPVLFAFSTSRGTLLAGFQEVGWGGGTGRVLGGSSREANILPPPCYHLLPPVVTNTIFKATHIFCPASRIRLLENSEESASTWRRERLRGGIATKRALWRCRHLV